MQNKNFITRAPLSSAARHKKDPVYVDLLVDGNFKLVFSREDRKPVLIGLLNEFLPADVRITELEVAQQEQLPGKQGLKRSVFDLYCRTADGRRVVVEVQSRSREDYLDRMLYYSTWPVTEQKYTGENNYTLDAVYILSFLNFALIHDDDWKGAYGKGVVSSYSIREDGNGELMTDSLHFIYVELGRFGRSWEECGTVREQIMYLLKNMGSLQEMPDGADDESVLTLMDIVEVASLPEDEKDEYDRNMQNEFDIRTMNLMMREQGRAEGREEGREEGRKAGLAEGRASGLAEGRKSVAKALKAQNVAAGIIANSTGLSVQEIEAL